METEAKIGGIEERQQASEAGQWNEDGVVESKLSKQQVDELRSLLVEWQAEIREEWQKFKEEIRGLRTLSQRSELQHKDDGYTVYNQHVGRHRPSISGTDAASIHNRVALERAQCKRVGVKWSIWGR